MCEDLREYIARERAQWALRARLDTRRTHTTVSVFERLERLLRDREPRFIRELAGSWRSRPFSISQRQIEVAISSGEVPADLREQWRQAYSQIIAEQFSEAWGYAFNEGGRAVFTTIAQLQEAVDFGDLEIPLKRALDNWVSERGGALISQLTEQQSRAVSVILRRHIVQDPLAPRELGVLLRSVVGVDQRQAGALSRIRQAATQSGATQAQVDSLVERTRSRMIRARATRIARTELADAYNQGTRDTVESAFIEEPQTLQRIRVVWMTSRDERVCPVCGPLDGTVIGFTETFGGPTGSLLRPPAHPMCRCTLLYRFPGE